MLLADQVYSGVPASWFGRQQEIEVGPMSGNSNIIFWLEQHGFDATEEKVQLIRSAAKSTNRVLTEAEILALLP